MYGFVSTHIHCGLSKSQGKLSRCQFRNHQQNCLQEWPLDSSKHTAPVYSELFKENGVDAEDIITKTACKADAWIRQCTQPLFTQKYSRKPESPLTRKSSPKLLTELTPGFVSAHSPRWLINSQAKLSRCVLRNHHRNSLQSYAWIRQSTMPLLTQK